MAALTLFDWSVVVVIQCACWEEGDASPVVHGGFLEA